MAIDICSEISSLSISPRISFSHDLNHLDQQDHHHHNHHQQNGQNFDHNPVSDFDFCVIKNDNNFTFEFSSADELFSDGKILPIQIKTTSRIHQNPSDHDQVRKNDNSAKKVRLKEFLSSSYDTEDEEDQEENDNDDDKKPRQSNYMSFWKFRRSSSLNLDKIKSLHFISRSNSTGSTQQSRKPSLRKQQSVNSSSAKAGNSNYKRSSSFSSYYNNNNSSNSCGIAGGSQYYGNNGNNGVRVSPVLNLPQPYISKVTISFFGFGSLFCNGKVRKKKK